MNYWLHLPVCACWLKQLVVKHVRQLKHTYAFSAVKINVVRKNVHSCTHAAFSTVRTFRSRRCSSRSKIKKMVDNRRRIKTAGYFRLMCHSGRYFVISETTNKPSQSWFDIIIDVTCAHFHSASFTMTSVLRRLSHFRILSPSFVQACWPKLRQLVSCKEFCAHELNSSNSRIEIAATFSRNSSGLSHRIPREFSTISSVFWQ